MFDDHYHPIAVYRKSASNKQKAWGETDTSSSPDPAVPFLVGYKKSHDIMGYVSGRSADEVQRSPNFAKINESGMSLYCSVSEDIQAEDVVVFEGFDGRVKVFAVDGETDMDYVSPWTGWEGGKEVYLHRYTKPRS